MVREYYKTGHPKFAQATIVAISLKMFLQLNLIAMQNAKRGKRIMLQEVLFVVAFVKSGLDVYRVVTWQKQPENPC